MKDFFSFCPCNFILDVLQLVLVIDMPYTVASSPVKKSLPSGANRLWVRVFNKTYKKSGDDAARKAAWAAVKSAGYSKGKEGKWTKKSD